MAFIFCTYTYKCMLCYFRIRCLTTDIITSSNSSLAGFGRCGEASTSLHCTPDGSGGNAIRSRSHEVTSRLFASSATLATPGNKQEKGTQQSPAPAVRWGTTRDLSARDECNLYICNIFVQVLFFYTFGRHARDYSWTGAVLRKGAQRCKQRNSIGMRCDEIGVRRG